MNGKKAKKIRRLADTMLVAWLHKNLPEGSEKITLQNISLYLPKDKYFINAYGSRCANFYTSKWTVNKIKKHLKFNPSTVNFIIEDL